MVWVCGALGSTTMGSSKTRSMVSRDDVVVVAVSMVNEQMSEVLRRDY